jgi:hypothetical protein
MSILSKLDAIYIQRLEKRFWAKVDKTPGQGPHGDCWGWLSAKNKDGYGLFQIGGTKTVRVTRLVLELNHVMPNAGQIVLHSCDNPNCLNPSHLSYGTHRRNMAEMVERGRSAKGDRHSSRLIPGSRKGEKNGRSLLTSSHVSEIKTRYKPREVAAKQLAQEYKVSVSTIKDILKGKNWSWINISELK